MSTFHGLEMAKQALFAQQSALYTTGNNISNANTKGYSRQRVNFETQSPYPTASRNRPEIPGQMGTGVKVGSIERVRDEFLDVQFRGENSKKGYWETKSKALARMENIMNETTDRGLSKSMSLFWDSLQDLATNPTNSGARSVVVERGVALADTFNHISKSLENVRSDLQAEINNKVDHTNSLLKQIHNINEQIKQIEPHGYVPNDLYDDRDRLIDELSEIVNIKVDYEKTSENSSGIQDGIAVIEVAGEDGKGLGINLVEEGQYNKLSVGYEGDETKGYNAVSKITIENSSENITLSSKSGSLSALIHSYGYTTEDGNVQGEFPQMLDDLDDMAKSFVKEFNNIHNQVNGQNFFDEDNLTADTIKVHEDIINDPEKVVVNSEDGVEDGKIAQKLADFFDDSFDIGDKNTSVNKFYQSLVGEMGVNIQESNKMADNTNILLSQVNNQRQSVSSVSLDEEMSNMIKFQHAYNAAARSMTSIDEMLDRIINSMGLVGR